MKGKELSEFMKKTGVHELPIQWQNVIKRIYGAGVKMDIINELKNFAEENKSEMSVNVYNGIWNIIQSIEHEKNET